MTVTDQWHRVLGLVRLPDEPHILLASPDNEAEVLVALSRRWPRAHVLALEIGGRGEPSESPEGIAVQQRVSADAVADWRAKGDAGLDLVLFDHALDDIVLEAVARSEGTVEGDRRGEHAPMVRAVRAYWRSGELERVARPALARLVGVCERALSPGALIVFSHRVAAADLPGQPMDLYTDHLALARRWLTSSGLPLEEVRLDALDPHWWMCLRRATATS